MKTPTYLLALLLYAAAVKAAVLAVLLLPFLNATAQSPQGGAKVSYVQCPPDMAFDPTKQYQTITRQFGTLDNPIMCTEYVDWKADGAACQVAFVCEDAT